MELAEGETLEVRGSAPDPYVIQNHGRYYSCTCPSWTYQKGLMSQRKPCKHLRSVLGSGPRVTITTPRIPEKRERNPNVIEDLEGREYELGD